MTVDKLAYAQELMTLDVRQRHQDWTSRDKDKAELLRSDLGRVNKDLRERALEDYNADDVEDEMTMTMTAMEMVKTLRF